MKYCGTVTDRSFGEHVYTTLEHMRRCGHIVGHPNVIEAQKRRIYSDEVPMKLKNYKYNPIYVFRKYFEMSENKKRLLRWREAFE